MNLYNYKRKLKRKKSNQTRTKSLRFLGKSTAVWGKMHKENVMAAQYKGSCNETSNCSS